MPPSRRRALSADLSLAVVLGLTALAATSASAQTVDPIVRAFALSLDAPTQSVRQGQTAIFYGSIKNLTSQQLSITIYSFDDGFGDSPSPTLGIDTYLIPPLPAFGSYQGLLFDIPTSHGQLPFYSQPVPIGTYGPFPLTLGAQVYDPSHGYFTYTSNVAPTTLTVLPLAVPEPAPAALLALGLLPVGLLVRRRRTAALLTGCSLQSNGPVPRVGGPGHF